MKKISYGFVVVMLILLLSPLNIGASCWTERMGCRREILTADLGVWDTFVGLSGCDVAYGACCLQG